MKKGNSMLYLNTQYEENLDSAAAEDDKPTPQVPHLLGPASLLPTNEKLIDL